MRIKDGIKKLDIEKKAQPLQNTETKLCGIDTVHHNVVTNDIIYLTLLFDVQELRDYVPQMSFLSTLLGYMDTKKHTYTEFDTETNFYTGGIASDLSIYCQTNDKYSLKYEVRTKVLKSQINHAVELLSELMFETLFTDEKHLREVVAETRSRLKVRLMSAGHQAAAARVLAGLSESSWLNDYSVGVGYYDYLVKLDENFDEEKDKLIEGCRQLVKAMFRKDKLLISCTCADSDMDVLEKALSVLVKDFDNNCEEADLSQLDKYIPETEIKKEAYTTPAEIQYVALGGSFRDIPDANQGALKVVSHLLNYDYLWNEVRVKGGAYGVGCRFNREGDGYFTSYRDPNLSSTLEVYREAVE